MEKNQIIFSKLKRKPWQWSKWLTQNLNFKTPIEPVNDWKYLCVCVNWFSWVSDVLIFCSSACQLDCYQKSQFNDLDASFKRCPNSPETHVESMSGKFNFIVRSRFWFHQTCFKFPGNKDENTRVVYRVTWTTPVQFRFHLTKTSPWVSLRVSNHWQLSHLKWHREIGKVLIEKLSLMMKPEQKRSVKLKQSKNAFMSFSTMANNQH